LAGPRELPYKMTADLIAGITNAAQAQINEFQEKQAAEAPQEPAAE